MPKALFIFISLLPVIAMASQEMYTSWESVSVITSFPSPYGKTTVIISTEIQDGTQRVAEIRLECEFGTIIVPKKAFADLDLPQLKTLVLTTEKGYDPEPWVYVKFSFGEPHPGTEQVFKRVVIAIQNKEVVYRAFETPTKDSEIKWEREDM